MKVNSVTTNVGDIYRILPSRRLVKDQNCLLLTWIGCVPRLWYCLPMNPSATPMGKDNKIVDVLYYVWYVW